jgi:prepilin-type N-terminal cleavage/methylation domain-containing protein
MNGFAKRGYSLVELLVAMMVALVLTALVASAISAARTSQKAAATRATIGKLSQILESQLERYASRPVSMAGLPATSSGTPLMTRNAYRAWYLRRQLKGPSWAGGISAPTVPIRSASPARLRPRAPRLLRPWA